MPDFVTLTRDELERTANPCAGIDGAAEPLTDLGNAHRMLSVFGGSLRFVPAWGKWLAYDGKRWQVDESNAHVHRSAQRTARAMMDTVPSAPNRDELFKAAKRAESVSGMRAMVAMAESASGIAVGHRDLDAYPYLLNVQNGVLDVRTGELHPHSPTLLLTRIANAEWYPGAPAPQFHAFLERVQPDPEVRAFLARLLGLAVVGKVDEHLLPIMYGNGQNGKTVLLETVIKVLGDHAGVVSRDVLIDHGSAHPTGTADLFGLRFAVASESDAGAKLAEGTVKSLTGGDRIKARRMREDFWEFEPSHLVTLMSNHKPVVRGTDDGIWRRVLLVPFEVKITDAERVNDLQGKIAASESAGVLGWLVRGYQEWITRGLDAPQSVRVATENYRAESDDIGRFIEQTCYLSPAATVPAAELFDRWRRWATAENVPPGTMTAFGTEMGRRGYAVRKRKHSPAVGSCCGA